MRWDTVNIGSSLSKNVNVRNTGSAPLTVATASIAPGSGSTSGEFTITTGSLPQLLPGESGTYGVAFAPSAEGTRTATLTVTSNGGTKSVTLIGVGKTFINSVDDDATPLVARVFPQPSTSVLTVECTALADGVVDVDIVNITGQRVLSTRSVMLGSRLTVPVDGLARGMYSLRIIAGGKPRVTTFFLHE